MTFKDWIVKMRAANEVPFGTAYEVLAQKAWNAAREACAELCEDLDTYEPEIRQECADAIREHI